MKIGKRTAALAGALLLAMIGAGCGGSDTTSSATSAAAEATSAVETAAAEATSAASEATSAVETAASEATSAAETAASEATSAAAAGPALKVGLSYDLGGRGDKSFNDSAARGLEQAKAELGITFEELSPAKAEDRVENLKLLSDAGDNPIIAVGFAFAEGLAEIAPAHPDITYAIIDSVVEARTSAASSSPRSRAPSSSALPRRSSRRPASWASSAASRWT